MQGMEALTIGSVTLRTAPDRAVIIEHTGPGGTVQLAIDAARLERWCLKLLREEQFRPAREGGL